MDLFLYAHLVKLRSHRGKYLVAKEDTETVTQDQNGSSGRNAQWTVELVPDSDSTIRLKSCYNNYLTASGQPFLPLIRNGLKVLQSLPQSLDSSLEWHPIKEGTKLKLKTHNGNFLRAHRVFNSVTHDSTPLEM
ncbi:uncharacterized protein LOC132180067 [Corylus avellana]|uniref:uncharacterized protein LOC132180067 n=1 Tax=Corylus avellana TaxID=13451 RepID=UPI00286CB550|nr:uncharacterized protein LOC132180067 [Corylus avellana]